MKAVFDENNYTVVGVNGYRVGNLTKEQAFVRAGRLQQEMATAGWAGQVRVFYRDGTLVPQTAEGGVR